MKHLDPDPFSLHPRLFTLGKGIPVGEEFRVKGLGFGGVGVQNL